MSFSMRAPAALTALFGIVTAFTQARFMGDTIDYVIEAPRFASHAWEFGHLWWVPLGWRAMQVAQFLVPGMTATELRFTLLGFYIGVNLVSGLACVLLLYGCARRLSCSQLTAVAVATAFLFSQAFLNFTQTGSSYIPGLAWMLLAVYLNIVNATAGEVPASRIQAVLPYLSGAALAASICCWFPYVLTIPALLLMPLLLGGWQTRHRWSMARWTVGLILVLGLGYGLAMHSLGITDVASFRAWMDQSAHGVKTGGLSRAAFGLARSFVFMGEDGLLFKRYLLGDPYNPVSLADLVRLSLWKFALFYLSMTALFFGLLGSPQGRRLLVLALVGCLPVFVFGVFWQGGDMERYLPLYPFIFLGVAFLGTEPTRQLARLLVAGFFVVTLLVNGWVYSTWQVSAHKHEQAQRILQLRGHLRPGSQVVVVRDRLLLFPRDFPFASNSWGLSVFETATPGLARTKNWREDFARQVRQTWAAGGDIWLSRRLSLPRPHPNSTWVEGDDPALKWHDVARYFRRFEVEDEVGGPDGFAKLVPCSENERLLDEKP